MELPYICIQYKFKKKTHNKNRPMITYSKKDWQKKTQFQMQKVVSKKKQQYFGEHSKKQQKSYIWNAKTTTKTKTKKQKWFQPKFRTKNIKSLYRSDRTDYKYLETYSLLRLQWDKFLILV